LWQIFSNRILDGSIAASISITFVRYVLKAPNIFRNTVF